MAVDHLDFCLRVHCNFLISGGRNNYNLGDLLGKKKKKKEVIVPRHLFRFYIRVLVLKYLFACKLKT